MQQLISVLYGSSSSLSITPKITNGNLSVLRWIAIAIDHEITPLVCRRYLVTAGWNETNSLRWSSLVSFPNRMASLSREDFRTWILLAMGAMVSDSARPVALLKGWHGGRSLRSAGTSSSELGRLHRADLVEGSVWSVLDALEDNISWRELWVTIKTHWDHGFVLKKGI